MNVLYIGRFYPQGIVETIQEDTYGQVGFSNHNFEMSLVKGLSLQENVNLRVITAPMVFSFPHNNRKIKYPKIKYKEGGIPIYSTGFNNIVGLNMISTFHSLRKAIGEELKAFEGERVTIIVNTPSLILSEALFRNLKKTTKKVTTVLIVPDVPECMLEMSGKFTYKGKLIQKINERTAKLARRYDKYVFLTEAMNDFYNAKPENYIVMEGLIDMDKGFSSQIIQGQEIDKEIILYAGTLRRIFGVMNLIEVFEKGNFPNTELWICGSGECSDEIAARSISNPNIKFFGLVDSARARELQTQATILVNPRSAEGRYTKYSFPSKTIEYLLAGKTVVMNRLPGIPKEYDDFIYYPVNEGTDAWIEKISEIINSDSVKRRWLESAGREFILNKKTARIQCKRIISLSV